jgi:hypothetical protein
MLSNFTGKSEVSEDDINLLQVVSVGAFDKTRLQKYIELLSTRATSECLATLNR